jgi:hypothetical protein
VPQRNRRDPSRRPFGPFRPPSAASHGFNVKRRSRAALLLLVLLIPGPPRARRVRGGKSPKGRAHDARAFAVGTGMCRQRTSVAHSRSRPASPADRALGGALLFGYFLLGKQEKVTRSPGMASEKTQGREAVLATTTKPEQKQTGPGFRRDDEAREMTRTRNQRRSDGFHLSASRDFVRKNSNAALERLTSSSHDQHECPPHR